MPRPLILNTSLTIAIFVPLSTIPTISLMSGCESTQIRDLLNSPTAMDLLSPLIKDAANNYIADLTNLAAMLADIKTLQGALAFIDQIQPTLKQLNTAYQTLASTTSEERQWLWEAFGPKLNTANTAFLNQSESLTNNTWSRLLTPVIDNVELFK